MTGKVITGENGDRTGENGVRTGESGVRTGENGARIGESGVRLSENGVRTGENGDRTGENGVRTGKSGVRTGENGDRTGESGDRTGENGVRLSLSGDLTVKTARRLFDRTPVFGAGVVSVDLASVGETDSAGLALLVHWCNRASASSAELKFSGAPAQLRRLSEITGLEGLFGD